MVYDHLYIPLTSKWDKFLPAVKHSCEKANWWVGQDFWKKKPTFFLVLNLVTTGKQIEKNFCLLKKYFKTLKDMIIDTANFFESFTFFQGGWNNVEIWKFDATSRAYSRPISRSTIERCPLLRKLYKALFRCKKTKFLVPFFSKKCPLWPVSNAALNF